MFEYSMYTFENLILMILCLMTMRSYLFERLLLIGEIERLRQ